MWRWAAMQRHAWVCAIQAAADAEPSLSCWTLQAPHAAPQPARQRRRPPPRPHAPAHAAHGRLRRGLRLGGPVWRHAAHGLRRPSWRRRRQRQQRRRAPRRRPQAPRRRPVRSHAADARDGGGHAAGGPAARHAVQRQGLHGRRLRHAAAAGRVGGESQGGGGARAASKCMPRGSTVEPCAHIRGQDAAMVGSGAAASSQGWLGVPA